MIFIPLNVQHTHTHSRMHLQPYDTIVNIYKFIVLLDNINIRLFKINQYNKSTISNRKEYAIIFDKIFNVVFICRKFPEQQLWVVLAVEET